MTSARTAYRQTNVHGASAIRLVILLYDQIIHDLVQAEDATRNRDIERRTQMLNHAILVIAYLQSPLDFERGGKVAENLSHFYDALRHNLVAVQFRPSAPGIRQQITDVQAVREAWLEVERAESSPPAPVRSPAPHASPAAPDNSRRMDWEG